jgi:hypothetical protein
VRPPVFGHEFGAEPVPQSSRLTYSWPVPAGAQSDLWQVITSGQRPYRVERGRQRGRTEVLRRISVGPLRRISGAGDPCQNPRRRLGQFGLETGRLRYRSRPCQNE